MSADHITCVLVPKITIETRLVYPANITGLSAVHCQFFDANAAILIHLHLVRKERRPHWTGRKQQQERSRSLWNCDPDTLTEGFNMCVQAWVKPEQWGANKGKARVSEDRKREEEKTPRKKTAGTNKKLRIDYMSPVMSNALSKPGMNPAELVVP